MTTLEPSLPAETIERFLTDRGSFPGRPSRVELIQTHASWVALTPRFVYKIKKPVDLGFLDFSTLQKRRHYCEREVYLNSRLSPGCYLGVVPIARTPAGLRFGSAGKVVEYAVKMRRLGKGSFLLYRIEHGSAALRDLDRVAKSLARFYRAQKQTPSLAAWGEVSKLRISTNENFRQTVPLQGVTVSTCAWSAVRHFTNLFYRRHASLFSSRIRDGRIIDGHGDLRLEHIHLDARKVTIFDCIEFNDRFRHIDVVNDLAFLTMDLAFHGRSDLATHFAQRMAKTLQDRGMFRLLDFYQCYRAFVRGKVESLRAGEKEVPPDQQAEGRRLAREYFRLALRYAVAGSEPMVLIVMGNAGSGKSSLAEKLGHELEWRVISSDRERKRLARVPLHLRGTLKERARLYSRSMTDRTYARLLEGAVREIEGRRAVILDATFGSRAVRSTFRKQLQRKGISFCFLEVQASIAEIKRRLRDRSRSAFEISDARLEDWPTLQRAYEPPMELESHYFLRVRSRRQPEATVTSALKQLAERRVELAGAEKQLL